jgi:hypothetical protein
MATVTRDKQLDDRVRDAKTRADRIERAKQLKQEAEEQENKQPSSFANQRGQRWSNR